MADNGKLDMKKGFSNNFILYLLAAILAVLMLQNLWDTKVAKVSFSYQLEPLVNLELIQPEDSRKIAVNDNLVTFGGKFYDRLSDESKIRYKYLELLDSQHQLSQEREYLENELKTYRARIQESGDLFLHLSGIPIPPAGYTIVDDVYTGQDSIVLTQLSKKNLSSLKDVQKSLLAVKSSPTDEGTREVGKAVLELVQQFRSPALGIGSESIKQTLRDLEKQVLAANNSELNVNEKLNTYEKALQQTSAIVQELDQETDHTRLSKLRSVRNYKQILDEHAKLITQVEDNQAQLEKNRQSVNSVIWFFNNQELSSRALEKQDPELYHHWFVTAKEEWNNFEKNKGGYFKAPDQPVNTVLEKTFRSEEPPPKYLSYLFPALLAFSGILILYMLFARQMKGVGSNALSFGKSPAKLVLPKGPNRITFKDVAGVDEALEELQEIVEFLKNPHKFTTLGGRIPKGVLCIGPPGTGKTLVAKAVAGEADRPFFSISGSDFVEMFVGVGASRIRDLFDQAKKNAPCIIFIDEIDAVGRHRGAGIGGGHDEREQTLNQLLVEMDGFDTQEGVILMAATNRPDVLDRALLRPGRFDRRVVIGFPDIKGRYEILKVHARKIKMGSSVDLMALARSTPGCSGADLANMLNEAALLAARRNRTAVTMPEVMEARDKVLYGKERRSLEMDEQEKKTTAYHESGHTIVGLVVKHGDPIDKVTIIPRGISLGATMFMPKKNRVSYWKKELHDQLAVLMGGRVAEEVFLGDISSGAKQDIERATQMARSMVCEWGMSEKLGTVAYDERNEPGQYGGMGYYEKKYSEETARSIDSEVRALLEVAYALAKKIVIENREKLELMTQMLMEFETLDSDDITKIMEGTWNSDEKRERLKSAADLHKKPSVTPPPPPLDHPVAAVRNQTNNIVGSVLNLNNLTWSPTNDIASPAGDPQLDAGTGALVMVWSVVNGPILYSRSLVFPPVWSSPGQFVSVTAATGTNPSLSVNNNTAVVIWESDITSSIKSALLSPLNAPNWTPIADLPPGDTPKVAGENGRFVAVWVDSTDNRVHGAILNNTVWTSITPLSTPGQTVENPQVAVDLAGNAYAIWANTTTQTIQGATLATGSTTWIATNDLSPAGGSNPKIKSLLPGNALAVWQLTSNTPDAVPFMQVQASFFPFELQPPVSPISPPSNFSGSVLKNRFATQTDIIHVLTWNPSPDPAVEGYRLFENGVLVATIPASGPFTFTLHNRCRGQIYSYTLVAFNASSVSSPLTLILP